MSGIAGRRWKDLTPDQKRRRMAWTRGGSMLAAPGERPLPVDPEVHRIVEEIRARVRGRRGRV